VVTIRVRKAKGRQTRHTHVAKRIRAKNGTYVAVPNLPKALRRIRRLRLSVSYAGDLTHRPQALVRYVRVMLP